jgi:hypothetical protein
MAGYVIPDEPRGAIRPNLAVRSIWPFLAMMISGPLPGFAWLAFNAWALGCRDAARLTVTCALAYLAAKGMVLWIYLFPDPAQRVLDAAGLGSGLALKLLLIGCAGTAMGLAYFIARGQSHNEEFRSVYGPPLAEGGRVLVLLILVNFFGLRHLPVEVALLWRWTLL